jgi:hypothetical protein
MNFSHVPAFTSTVESTVALIATASPPRGHLLNSNRDELEKCILQKNILKVAQWCFSPER